MTFTEATSTVAVGEGGYSTTLSAVKRPTTKATVVKNPKTFWARTMVECIVVEWGCGGEETGLC